MKSLVFFAILFTLSSVYSSTHGPTDPEKAYIDSLKANIKYSINHIALLVGEPKNTALVNFFLNKKTLKNLITAERKDPIGVIAVVRKIGKILCLDRQGCMANFDLSLLNSCLTPTPQFWVNQLGNEVVRFHKYVKDNLLSPNFDMAEYIGRIFIVLSDYHQVLVEVEPYPDIASKLNIHFQFDELIPPLSEACLELTASKWPEFYEKLENAVHKKASENKTKSNSGGSESEGEETSEDETSEEFGNVNQTKYNQEDNEDNKRDISLIKYSIEHIVLLVGEPKNTALVNFFLNEKTVKNLITAKSKDPNGVTAVVRKIDNILCLDRQGCMANFDFVKVKKELKKDPQFWVNLLGNAVVKFHKYVEDNLLSPNFKMAEYLSGIHDVLTYYHELLETVKPYPDIASKLNIHFQFDQLIPRLSAACLDLTPENWPRGTYDILKNNIAKVVDDDDGKNKGNQGDQNIPKVIDDDDGKNKGNQGDQNIPKVVDDDDDGKNKGNQGDQNIPKVVDDDDDGKNKGNQGDQNIPKVIDDDDGKNKGNQGGQNGTCLELTASKWPEFYEKLENAVHKKASEKKTKSNSGGSESEGEETSEDETSEEDNKDIKRDMFNMNYSINHIASLVDKPKNTALVNFFLKKETMKNLMSAKSKDPNGLTAVVRKIDNILCLDRQGCMANFDFGKLEEELKVDPRFSEQSNWVNLLGNAVVRFHEYLEHSLLSPNFNMAGYFGGIHDVLSNYYELLETIKTYPDIASKLNIHFQFDQLIPRLSAACLDLTPANWPGTYDFLKNNIAKVVDDDDDGKNKGNQGGQNGTSNSPLSPGMKILFFGILPLVFIAIFATIFIFLKRK